MATLTELCAGLPLDPLPPLRPRDASLPHAPVRTPQLSGDEKKVNKNIHRIELNSLGGVTVWRHDIAVKEVDYQWYT